MQSDSTNIRIGVDVGAPVEEGSEKCSARLDINIGKVSADAQLSEMKALIGGAEVGLSALLSVVASPGKQQELADIIDDLFNGKGPSKLATDISQAALSGMISYRIFQADGNRVVLQLKPGAMTEDMITTQVTGVVQGLGIEAATSNDNVNLSANATSGVDFFDALEGHKTGLSTIATFGKSFSLEINGKCPAGSLVEAKVWELLSQFQPGSPLELLKLMRNIDASFSFKGIDELPADLQRRIAVSKEFEKFPQTPKAREGSEEHIFFKKLIPLIEPQVDIYATLENVAAVRVSVRVPGWGTAFVTTHD